MCLALKVEGFKSMSSLLGFVRLVLYEFIQTKPIENA